MSIKDEVCVGLVGAGYASHLHCASYQRISKIKVRLKTIVDVDIDKAEVLKKKYGFENISLNFDELLSDHEIDVIDLCVPPFLHVPMAIKALRSGKHVICEKPLTGYFGLPGDIEPIGKTVNKVKMYEEVIKSMDLLKEVVETSDKKLFYAENYIYAAPIQKMAEIITRKKSKILLINGVIGVKGSSSPVAGEWKTTGGGSLARNGVHLIAAIIWLKQVEAKARNEIITINSIVADTSVSTACLNEHEHRHIKARPVDVEDNAAVSIVFSDGTMALILASDTMLGGSKNAINVYCNDSTLTCNITPTDILNTYFLDEEDIEDLYLAEMLPSKLGWNKAFILDEFIRGHAVELQDFMESIVQEKNPSSDFALAYDTMKLIYAAYQSAEEGRRINFI